MKKIYVFLAIFLLSSPAFAATNVPFTIAMSEAVNVTGSPRVAVDVGGVTRYATYASGTGTSSLTFTYAAQAGDVDLDGVTLSSPIDLNGGTITDLNGNPETDFTFTVPDTSGIKIDYPSLSMDFIADADGRYTLNGTAYNDLPAFLSATGGTFARNSVGTYYDASGTLQTASANQPRFDHDPVTHAPKGILIEESRTNLLTYSQMSSTTGWAGSNTSIVTVNDPGSFPVGATSCLRNEINAGQANGFTYKSINLSLNTVYTMSAWVYIPSSVPTGKATITAWYDNSGWLTISSTTIVERDQWVKKHLTFTSNGTYTSHIVGVGLAGTTPGLQSYACLAQLEQGAFPTSYIPTTTAAVTRQADSLSFNTSGWFNASEGQLFSSVNPAYASFSNYPQIALFGDGTSTNFIAYTLFPGNTYIMEWKQSASTLYNLSGGNVATGSETKLIGAYKNNSSIVVKNGATVNTSAATINSLPITLFSIGSNLARGGSDGRYSGTISNLKYYPTRISDTQLQLLTQ